MNVVHANGDNLCRLVACRLHQMLTAAISDAKATALTKTGMSFPGQARKIPAPSYHLWGFAWLFAADTMQNLNKMTIAAARVDFPMDSKYVSIDMAR